MYYNKCSQKAQDPFLLSNIRSLISNIIKIISMHILFKIKRFQRIVGKLFLHEKGSLGVDQNTGGGD